MTSSHSSEVSLELANEKFQFSPTGLAIKGQPTFEEWELCGNQLKYVEKAVRWWIGDWLNYGERRWGQMYSQALDATDFAQGTLQNMKYVTGKIESSRRNEDVSFSHHLEVASLPPIEQDAWLDKAAKEKLPVRELRQQIKASRNGEPDYTFMVQNIINGLDTLAELYPPGVEVIKQHLENL